MGKGGHSRAPDCAWLWRCWRPALLRRRSASGARAASDTLDAKHQVLLRADRIVYDTRKSAVSAEGNVEIDYKDSILLADSITYNQKTDTVTANGHISVLGGDGNVAFADHVVLTEGMRDGVLDGFRALIGKDGRLAAQRAVREDQSIIYATRAVYTPCKICNKPGKRTPTWEVKAGKIVWDEKRHRIYYHDATHRTVRRAGALHADLQPRRSDRKAQVRLSRAGDRFVDDDRHLLAAAVSMWR